MAHITADNYDTLIGYTGTWNIDLTDYGHTTSTPGSSASLDFTGDAIMIYGYSKDGANVTLEMNAGESQVIQIPPWFIKPSFEMGMSGRESHHLKLTLINGTFQLNRLVWHDPQATINRAGPLYALNDTDSVKTSGKWTNSYEPEVQTDFKNTNEQSASITFRFEGTGIEVMGLAGPNTGIFNATLDDLAPVVRNTSASTNRVAILHRNDGLANGPHTLTLTSTGQKPIQINRAQVYAPPSDGSVMTMTAIISSPSTEAVFQSYHHAVGYEQICVAGLVLAVLSFAGVLVLSFMFWRRRTPQYTKTV